MWRDALAHKAQAPYMNHELAGGALRSLAFCPYEDVLAAGHVGGLSTLLVPGAGEPNFDSLVADPYEKGPQRREREVHQLLQKLQPDMIVLDPTTIGQVGGRYGVSIGYSVRCFTSCSRIDRAQRYHHWPGGWRLYVRM